MNRIKKNYLYNVLYQILLVLFPLITFPYISKTLGVDNYGLYSYCNSIVSYFILAASLGVQYYGAREIAENSQSKKKLLLTFKSIFKIQVIAHILVILIYIITCVIFFRNTLFLSLMFTIYLIANCFNISWFYTGVENLKLVALKNFIINLISIVLIFGFVKDKHDVVLYAFIFSISHLISNIYYWLFLKKYINFKDLFVNHHIKFSWLHLKGMALLFLPRLALRIYDLLDETMLGNLSHISQVGLYSCARKIMLLPRLIVIPLSTVLLPFLSKQKKNEGKINEKLRNSSLIFTSWLSFGSIFGILAISKDFISIFFSNEYLNAIPILYFLSFYFFSLTFSTMLRDMYFLPEHEDTTYVKTVALGIPINIILNFILIPKWNAVGAAIATLISDYFILVIRIIILRKKINLKLILSRIVLFIISSFIMYFILNKISFAFPYQIINMLLEVIIGAGIYLLLTWPLLKNIIIVKKKQIS